MITKTKIDWTDFTWNPVWGCENKCPYCYARKIARRFAEKIYKKEMNFLIKNLNVDGFFAHGMRDYLERLKSFKPTWLESNYQKSFPKKPSIIFVNSMSDPMYWKQEWYEKIVKKIAENMQHTFVILTKYPQVYKKYIFPHNTWLGMTITKYSDFDKVWQNGEIGFLTNQNNIKFLSVEPIQEKLIITLFNVFIWAFNWIIVGPETGNRKNKYVCTPEMLEPFFDLDIPVFMKGACSKITDRPLRQEWPER